MKASAGIVLYKKENDDLFYFLVHPGGPFWKNKDHGAWSIPKGEILPDENPLDRAIIEFKEETGKAIQGEFLELSPLRQKAGKLVYAWATEGDIETSQLYSNTLQIEWPPKSGRLLEIPEVDQWQWFHSDEAKKRINLTQTSFLEELENLLQ
ncbi:NUDIX hydrolase [Chryseobacterium piperi]|uniref:NUDIX hydrolase n=1 Tax=Chryseobacterium piperi TaxID=558152 RepID=A0A086BCP8_9FLAO|nr:NUDIX domain-containing protein [Chryseobacterium piperi]ASW73533.1 NUDIX domain-containing protein [Chryseobacterium piperi]KFF26712.1 NUDIX hydrolase [Chryseobacterium piperi]